MIWDAILFNDELRLLEVRLRLLAGVVDHLVIVESTRTFTGLDKPLHFAGSGLDLSGFPGQVHAVTAELPVEVTDAWDRERAQRAAMGGWLRDHVAPGDLVLIGDVDELPRPEVVGRLARTLRQPVRLAMCDALYYANWHMPGPWMLGTLATRLDGFEDISVGAMLGAVLHADDRIVEEYVADAGWHLSFLGGADAIRAKLSAYSHQELNSAINQRSAFIESCLRYGSHFAGWAPLRKLPRAALDAELAALAGAAPDLFDFSPPPPRLATLAWTAWAWLRGRVPSRLSAWLDEHPRVVVLALGPLLVPVQAMRQVKRRLASPRRWPPDKRHVPSRA